MRRSLLYSLATCAVAGCAVAVVAVARPDKPPFRDVRATPRTFARVFARARAGDRIVLSAGDYGTFTGAARRKPVTIYAPPGVTARFSLEFRAAANLRLVGLTISGLTFMGTTHDITVAGSRFTGSGVVRTDQMVDSHIVFDRNTHAGIDVCPDCYEGRLEITGDSHRPSGVTVENSVFGPGGDADGLQIGADGVRVLHNAFIGIHQVDDVHTDSLQLYGASHTVIEGNYFRDFDTAIMAPDGGDHERITDNVFAGGGRYRPAIQLGSHHGTLFAHNLTENIDVHVDAKSGAPPGSDDVVRDNVILNGTLEVPASACVDCTVTHNLFDRRGLAAGSAVIVARPQLSGWRLRRGSPGAANASDGGNPGVRAAVGPAPRG